LGIGEWISVTAVYDMEEPYLKLFVDDVEDTGATCSNCASFGEISANDSILVGRTESEDLSTTYYFSGDLYDLRIYNIALSPE
jgi:hypothetical protein